MRNFCVQHQVKIGKVIEKEKVKESELYQRYLEAKKQEMETINEMIEEELTKTASIKEITSWYNIKQKIYDRLHSINKELLVLKQLHINKELIALKQLRKPSFTDRLKKIFK